MGGSTVYIISHTLSIECIQNNTLFHDRTFSLHIFHCALKILLLKAVTYVTSSCNTKKGIPNPCVPSHTPSYFGALIKYSFSVTLHASSLFASFVNTVGNQNSAFVPLGLNGAGGFTKKIQPNYLLQKLFILNYM